MPQDRERTPQSWHCAVDGGVEGPLGHRELVARILDGRIGPDSLVWHPGRDAWSRADEVPALAGLFRPEGPADEASAPPPLPGEAGEEGAVAEPDEAERPSSGAGDAPEEGAAAERSESRGDGESPQRPGARALAWMNEHVWETAAIAAVAAAALVAGLALSLGGGGDPPAGTTAEAGAVPSFGPARDTVVRAHVQRLREALGGSEAGGPEASALRSRPEDLAFQRRIAYRGLSRVADSTLVRFVAAWGEVLGRATAAECGALSAWQASSRVTWRAVGRLPPDRLEGLLRILDRATVMELEGAGDATQPPPDSLANESFRLLQEGLSPGRRDTLAAYLQVEVQQPALACWTDRLLFQRIAGLEPPHDRRLARAVVTRPGQQ